MLHTMASLAHPLSVNWHFLNAPFNIKPKKKRGVWLAMEI